MEVIDFVADNDPSEDVVIIDEVTTDIANKENNVQCNSQSNGQSPTTSATKRKRTKEEIEDARKQKERKVEENRIKKEQKDEEKRQKAAVKEEEKRKKAAAKEQKQGEKRRKAEAKEREAKRQKTVTSFFGIAKTSPFRNVENTPAQSDFDTTFLPLHLKPNCRLIKPNFANQTNTNDIMAWLSSNSTGTRGYNPDTATSLYEKLSLNKTEDEIRALVCRVPFKFLQFVEDIRPPYVGTFSKEKCWFATDPYSRLIPGLNYDYDSELEWDDGEEEGEELGDDETGDEVDEASDDEGMKEFVDETGESQRHMVYQLPTIIKWNDIKDLSFMSMEIELLNLINEPIDPYTNYWENNTSSSPISVSSLNSASLKPRKTISADGMKLLVEMIARNKAESKPYLVEVFKRNFPKFSKDAIRNSFNVVAEQVGKIWHIDPRVAEKYGVTV